MAKKRSKMPIDSGVLANSGGHLRQGEKRLAALSILLCLAAFFLAGWFLVIIPVAAICSTVIILRHHGKLTCSEWLLIALPYLLLIVPLMIAMMAMK